MGGFSRAGGAGGTGGATDAALVEEDEGGFALDAFEGKIGGVWEAVGAVAVDTATGDGGEEGSFEAVAERGLERMGGGEFGGFSEGDDRCDILRASAAAVFLSATQERGEGNSAVDIEGTDTFRRMELVSRETHEMHPEAFETERDFSESLHGVDVEDGFGFLNKAGDFFERPEDAGFVVGPEEGNQGGLRSNGRFQLVQVELARGIHGQAGDFKPLPGQILANSKRSAVLDRAGDDVAFLGSNGRLDRRGDRLGPAAGENQFLALTTRQRSYLTARRVDGRRRLTAESAATRGIAEAPPKPGLHRPQNLRHDGSRRVVVQINQGAHFRKGSPLSLRPTQCNPRLSQRWRESCLQKQISCLVSRLKYGRNATSGRHGDATIAIAADATKPACSASSPERITRVGGYRTALESRLGGNALR